MCLLDSQKASLEYNTYIILLNQINYFLNGICI
uniref:Uncharacterized protein n=1 Tax=Arundo donax TaxID=35708 RepID=A0A0A9E6M9_ARUDO